MDKYNRTRHCVFMLTYHMIFVTKWRKPAISVFLPPGACVQTVMRSLKTQLSKEVHAHKEYGPYVKQFLYDDAPFWSNSSFVATTGSVSLEVVKSYIEGQRTDEHKQKYEKKSNY